MTETIENWESFLRRSREQFQENLLVEPDSTKSLSDFEIIQAVGRGTFATVVLARLRGSHEYFAIKVLDKIRIIKLNQVRHVLNEKRFLQALNFRFIVRMVYFFKDNSYIYFVMPFINGGELFYYLRKEGRFSEALSVFYAAQVVLGLEYLHFLNVIYRDLKPENVLLDREGYIKITDLGFAKIVTTRTFTLCGTPDYLAPEMILCKGYSHAVDWWALGVFIYEMVAGYPPFYSAGEMRTYQLISTGTYRMIPAFSDELRDLLLQLLEVNPVQRLGTVDDDVERMKQHGWFRRIRWLELLNRNTNPPFVPTVSGPEDTRNLDPCEPFTLTEASEDLFQDEFKDF